jgi:hypothetical protein
MTVRELIARLETMCPSARVLLARDPKWPWEHDVAAVIERKSIEVDDRDEHWDPTDVLLLEGARAGFGPEFAWVDAAKAEAGGG